MITPYQEKVIAKREAKKGPKAAGKASIMKWYRNTERIRTGKPLSSGVGSCALCQVNRCGMCIAYGDAVRTGIGCCGGLYHEAVHYPSIENVWAVVDYLALAWVNKYRQPIQVGNYIYFLS
jgi:hypothetical protein